MIITFHVFPGTEGKAGMAAIHVDLSGITATGETGLGGCGDVSYPDLDNLVSRFILRLGDDVVKQAAVVVVKVLRDLLKSSSLP